MEAITLNGAFTIIALIISIIIHEVAHGYAAYALGDPTAKLAGRLTLNPVPHLDLFGSVLLPALLVFTNAGILFGWAKPVPYNPHNLKNARWGEAIVAIAGVATNFLIAIIFALFARYAFSIGEESLGTLASIIVFVNLFLGMFNLIPIPPLDGFTFLRGILPGHLSLSMRKLEEQVQSMGILSLIIFLFAFSYLFATPFFYFVRSIFEILIGS